MLRALRGGVAVGPAAVAVVSGATLGLSSAGLCSLWWAPAVTAVALLPQLIPPILGATTAAHRRLRAETRDWAHLLVVDNAADAAHAVVAAPVRAIARARELAGEAGLVQLEEMLGEQASRCSIAAAKRLSAWRDAMMPDRPLGRGRFLADAPGFSTPRSLSPLPRFARPEGMPRFLPRAARQMLARAIEPIDLVRLLHTSEIERRSLVAMLRLRVVILLAAPLTTAISFTQAVPMRQGASELANVAFFAAVGIALLDVAFSPLVVRAVFDEPDRRACRMLFVAEQSVAVVLLLTSPCWACAAFLAGPINWVLRPRWRFASLALWSGASVAVGLGGALLFSHGAVSASIFETLIGMSVVFAISTSYGLMAPAVLSTLATIVVLSVWRERRSRKDWGALRGELDSALASAITAVSDELYGYAGPRERASARRRADEVLAGLSRAREDVAAGAPGRDAEARALSQLCLRSVRSVVPAIGVEPSVGLHSASIESLPADVSRLVLRRRRDAHALSGLVRQLALEAAVHGSGLLYIRLGVTDDGRVAVTVANEIGLDRPRGFGTGEAWLARRIAAIPGARLVRRGTADGLDYGTTAPVFAVTVSLAVDLFVSAAPWQTTPVSCDK